MSKPFQFIALAFFLSFVGCCVASALLQTIAWARHSRRGASVNMRALWKPEGHFDDIGLYQMRLAKRLIIMGGVAYLSYGVVMLVAQRVGGQ